MKAKCMMYIKKSKAPFDIICDNLFSVLDHMTSHDHDLTLFSPFKLNNIIAKKIGMLHIKCKLLTAASQRK